MQFQGCGFSFSFYSSTIADTLKDLSDVLRNMDTAYDHAGTQSRKEYSCFFNV